MFLVFTYLQHYFGVNYLVFVCDFKIKTAGDFNERLDSDDELDNLETDNGSCEVDNSERRDGILEFDPK